MVFSVSTRATCRKKLGKPSLACTVTEKKLLQMFTQPTRSVRSLHLTNTNPIEYCNAMYTIGNLSPE